MTMSSPARPESSPDRAPISDEEVRKLRRFVWADGAISPDEAAQLFALNDGADAANDWADFFVEAMCDYLIGRGQPRGYVTDADANWLIDHIDHDGRIDSHAELELIVRLLERAELVPESLKVFAMQSIEQTVLTGEGPTRRGGSIQPGQIDDAEVPLLRRMIFAPAGDGPAKVSRSEAEMLFRLKDATLGADNSAEWQRLFVQGIANHLMAHQNYVPPSREEAMRRARPYVANPGRVLAGLKKEVASLREARTATYGDEDRRVADHDRAFAADMAVTFDEAHWLDRLFDADGARDPIEQALVDFLAAESSPRD
ncbi:MAG TPA: hypothetical protein VNI79_06150 [Sphingomicrobium sp.]|nr:hypothetical protein [Sphingomicrobium sp.]